VELLVAERSAVPEHGRVGWVPNSGGREDVVERLLKKQVWTVCAAENHLSRARRFGESPLGTKKDSNSGRKMGEGMERQLKRGTWQ
jgi:hypothetical protein